MAGYMIADCLKPLVNCSILQFVWRFSYLDIDECASSGRNECDPNALCTNIEGSYICRCLKGFKGDGKTCTGDDDFLCSRNVWLEHIQLIFGQTITSLVKSSSSSLISLLFLFSASAELVCDPPCTGNTVCQNYSGDPECVCAEGFFGEGNCTGILHFDYIGLVVRPLYKSTNRYVHRYIGQLRIYLNNYLL